MTTSLFIEPLDVLFLRGNKLFGDPGSFGEALIPPWPSVVAGAIRSRMLADAHLDWNPARKGQPVDAHPQLGTPDAPGSFAITAFHLARRHVDGRVEALLQPPADLVIVEDDQGKPSVRALAPTALPHAAGGLQCSAPFALLPVLAERERRKPASGYWLAEAGWRQYLAGRAPEPAQLVKSSALWAIDPRIGVGLDAASGRASDGRLFSVQAIAMKKRGEHIDIDSQSGKAVPAGYDVGFLASVAGAEPPTDGLLRLGGDGRAAAIYRTADCHLPEPDYGAIAAARRCRLVLATPGIFEDGWLPTGIIQADGEFSLDLHGVKGRLVCAAVPRAEVISGWDLARWQPKPALRAVAAGAVYWLDQLDTTPEALRKLAETGLWREPCQDAARRAEGFNRIAIAAY